MALVIAYTDGSTDNTTGYGVLSTIKFIWIRGHAGNSMNEIADKLANKARLQVKEGVSCKPNN